MKYKTKYGILLGGVILTFTLFYFLSKKKPVVAKNVLLIGGLDTRKADKQLSEQTDLLKLGLGESFDVTSFRYNDISSGLKHIQTEKPKYVVLFSAGCAKSYEIAKA